MSEDRFEPGQVQYHDKTPKLLFSISCRRPTPAEGDPGDWSTNVLAHSAVDALAAALEQHPIMTGDMIMIVPVDHLDATQAAPLN